MMAWEQALRLAPDDPAAHEELVLVAPAGC